MMVYPKKISFSFSPAGFTSREQRICMISYIYLTITLFNYKKQYNNPLNNNKPMKLTVTH